MVAVSFGTLALMRSGYLPRVRAVWYELTDSEDTWWIYGWNWVKFKKGKIIDIK